MIHCSRTDCDFWLDGKCEYGGEAVSITVDGCETYEPAESIWDVSNLLTEEEIKTVHEWNKNKG